MKVPSMVWFFAGLAGAATFCGVPACAQSEIDPDHFESPNMEPLRPPKNGGAANAAAQTKRYDGEFVLPYSVQCNGKSLPAGKYSVSLSSDGKFGQATLNQKGQAIGIAGIIYSHAGKRANQALVIQHDGRTRRLSVIQVAELDLVFDWERWIDSSSNSETIRIERLPLTVMAAKR
jgi:hypothetical protein